MDEGSGKLARGCYTNELHLRAHLVRRASRIYYRRRVPASLPEIVGKRENWRSLRTGPRARWSERDCSPDSPGHQQNPLVRHPQRPDLLPAHGEAPGVRGLRPQPGEEEMLPAPAGARGHGARGHLPPAGRSANLRRLGDLRVLTGLPRPAPPGGPPPYFYGGLLSPGDVARSSFVRRRKQGLRLV